MGDDGEEDGDEERQIEEAAEAMVCQALGQQDWESAGERGEGEEGREEGMVKREGRSREGDKEVSGTRGKYILSDAVVSCK